MSGHQPPPDRMRSPGETWSLAAEAAEAAGRVGGVELGWLAALDALSGLDRRALVQVAAALAVLVGQSPTGLTRSLRAEADEAVASELWALPERPSAGCGGG